MMARTIKASGGTQLGKRARFLLTIPNALVELLQDQGTPASPDDVLNTINMVTANTSGGIAENQWRTA